MDGWYAWLAAPWIGRSLWRDDGETMGRARKTPARAVQLDTTEVAMGPCLFYPAHVFMCLVLVTADKCQSGSVGSSEQCRW